MTAPNEASETRAFPLGAVLSVTTGRLLCSLDELYDLLGFMVGEPVWTHQLPRASRESETWILEQQPQLRSVEVPADLHGEDAVLAWVAEQTPIYGDPLVLEPLRPGEHTSIHPVDELRMLRPDMPVVVVEAGEGT